MHGFTIFSDCQGCGYIHESSNEILVELKEIAVSVNGSLLTPGLQTTLNNYFCRPLKYLGLLGENEMVFFIGELSDLFKSRYFYQSVFRIDEDRIFEMFSPVAGRDHIYIGGKWK